MNFVIWWGEDCGSSRIDCFSFERAEVFPSSIAIVFGHDFIYAASAVHQGATGKIGVVEQPEVA